MTEEKELVKRLEDCAQVLADFNVLLEKYNSLPTQSRQIWDRLDWDQQDARDIQARLTSQVVTLTTFYESLMHFPQVLVEGALRQLATDIQSGRREATSVVLSATAGQEEHDVAWPQIFKDLKDLGISESLAIEHRSFIIDWFVEAINGGLLRVEAPDDGLGASASSISSQRESNPPKDTNIIWTAQRIVQHWNAREWHLAEKYLQQQSRAVQAGLTVSIKGVPSQPDARVLKHLLGVCASFQGDLERAMLLFESVLQGPYTSGTNLDEGVGPLQ